MYMKPTAKGLTPVFILTCLLSAPIIIWAFLIVVAFIFLPIVAYGLSGNFETGLPILLLLMTMSVSVFLSIIIIGIYRKNLLALMASIVVFPLIVALIIPMVLRAYVYHGNDIPIIMIITIYLAAAIIAAVYIRELKRNWRR